MKKHLASEDICTHLGDEYDRYLGAIIPPIFQNTLFTHKHTDHGYAYSRISNPTIELAEKKLAALEAGNWAVCYSSGVAAISAVIAYFAANESHIICIKNTYGRVNQLLEHYSRKFQISTTFVEGNDPAEIKAAIRPETKLIYLESPSSLVYQMQDLEAIACIAKSHDIYTAIDNTWASPIFQNPLCFGIDLVIHSLSKYIGGHSDLIGGVVIGADMEMGTGFHEERAMFGAVMDPHLSWMVTRSIRTLPVRMKQHQENALRVASFLEGHPKVSQVFYPGLASHPQYELGLKQMSGYSGVMSIAVSGEPEQVAKMLKQLQYFEVGSSWGGFESLIALLPFNEKLAGEMNETISVSAPKSLLRISVGLENVQSLINDLDRALHTLD
ncbi:trans-sulfuration enzyme family protein [Paenibacillus eucommiae]|uniref:Cystathionine gamma-lyase n=1 Tax=Paenibacillus eucommiae TaxID=1355755 RepID=A0ABS4ISW2_9BACL|nr:aminotransferase class I/II-fold pyridoxal phosphate-dependent enzyme [Paenibacillus eucommiae]MBP1990664.1 cystathionine gamma-lyase [Paenibacillus eucommiae]